MKDRELKLETPHTVTEIDNAKIDTYIHDVSLKDETVDLRKKVCLQKRC